MTAIAAVRVEPRQILKHAYDAARHLTDRVLHRRRHLAVLTRLGRTQPPTRILVICFGNIMRSPYMQSVLQRALPDTTVVSAGFYGSDRPAPEASVALAATRGLDLSRHRSRPITQAFVNNAELVIVMDSDQARRMARMFRVNPSRLVIAGDLDPTFEETRGIRDPWGQSHSVLESSYNRLDRCAATLVAVLRRAQ